MNITEVLKKAGPQEVQISGWDEKEITVKLRKPSLTEMIAGDYVPNPLLSTVSKLFRANPKELAEISETEAAKGMHCIASRALVEPSMEQLQAAGVSLTDDQYEQIYAYVLGGAAALERFRVVARNLTGRHVRDDACEGQSADGDQ